MEMFHRASLKLGLERAVLHGVTEKAAGGEGGEERGGGEEHEDSISALSSGALDVSEAGSSTTTGPPSPTGRLTSCLRQRPASKTAKISFDSRAARVPPHLGWYSESWLWSCSETARAGCHATRDACSMMNA